MQSITIWSDLACPWSYVTALRLHHMRDHLTADDVELTFRLRPFEAFEGAPPTLTRTAAEIAVLAQREHTAFSAYENPRWPTTFGPAYEAQKWGYSLGQDPGEHFDLALRRALFLHSHDLSNRAELLAVAEAEQLPSDSLAAALDSGAHRAAVTADIREAEELEITVTPTLILGDGTRHENPGVSVTWIRGLPVVTGDHPSVYEDIIRSAWID